MVYSIISELKKTKSRNDKEKILTENKDNKDLVEFFYLSLNPFINFYQKKDFESVGTDTPKVTLEEGMYHLNNDIQSRVYTGNSAIAYIESLLSDMSEDDVKVMKMILKKNPDCGVSTSTVNKVWPKLIPKFPVLLAESYSDKLGSKLDWESGVIIQEKYDGLRVNIIVDYDGSVTCKTRSGNTLEVFSRFDSISPKSGGFVLDGELLTLNEFTKEFNDRKTSNGICSKAIKGTMSLEESKTLFGVFWDYIPLSDFQNESSQLTYSDRYKLLTNFFDNNENDELFKIAESKVIHSQNQAKELFELALSQKKEGVMLKSKNLIWKHTRSNLQLKMKAELSGDLLCTGVALGTGKYSGLIGALVCQSSDGLIMVDVGTGLTDEDRAKDPTEYIGKIIEVCYNEVIQDRKKKTKSLFLPVFCKIRLDKEEANSCSELMSAKPIKESED